MSSVYFNARRAVEAMVFQFALIIVIREGVTEEYADDANRAIELLDRSIADAIPTDRRDDLVERRAARAAMRNIVHQIRGDDVPVAKLGLAIYYMMRNLIDQDLYVVVDDGNLDRAMNIILPALSEWTSEDRLDRSAFKGARRAFKSLQKDGYFTGVKWELCFE